MFVGHFAVALAAKRLAPRTSLGTLTFAAQWLDLLWPTLLMAGVERVRIEAAAHPLPLVNVTRPDVPAPTLDRAEVLASAPSVEDGQFKVPTILGEEP